MKKVLLISDGWKRLITYAWVVGIMDAINESDEEIGLFQCNCFGNWSFDEKHNQGEYNMFNLPHLENYDGIIIDCNNIVDEMQKEKLIERLRVSKVPVVSLTYTIDGFYYAGIDNKAPIKELMEHLYHHHGCRSFVFAGGPKDNFENCKREQAFIESLEKFGIPLEDGMILYGDFDYATGERYMEQMMGKGEQAPLPDVIVCANDNIAAGICHKAEHFGLRVPDDFLVTGFDNLDKAAFFRPQITTVAHDRAMISKTAMQILFDVWEGKEVSQFRFVPAECIMAESCGCPNNGRVDYRKYVKDQIVYAVEKQKADENLVALEKQLTECENFDDLFQEISEYFAGLECDGFYVIVNKKLYDAGIGTEFPKEGYDLADMVVGYAKEKQGELPKMTVKELWEYAKKNAAGNAYMATPIHFRDQAVGFTVLKNGRFLYDNPYFYDIHTTFVRMLENLFKKICLENMNKQLAHLSNHDPLTGLYNRMAYSEMIVPRFKRYCAEGVPCAMAFFDVDHFKQINDTLGHQYGDMLLKRIAETLEETKPDHGYAYRFGGDEFVVFFPNATEETIATYREMVEGALLEKEIEVSIGVIVTNPAEEKTLDEYLVMADEKMYRIKQERKSGRV